MSFLAKKLKHRIIIKKGVDTPNFKGAFTRSYTELIRLWSGIKVLNPDGFMSGLAVVRGQTTSNLETHEFKVRYNSVVNHNINANPSTEGLGRSFNVGFQSSFDSILDLDPIKSDYFVFVESGSRTYGRLFKILRVIRDDNNKEWLNIRCSQIEEQGSGAVE